MAKQMLDNPVQFADKSPAMALYLTSMKGSHGANLSINDMRQIAADVEYYSSGAHPEEIGGKLQLAVLENGSVTTFEQPIQPGAVRLTPAIVGIADNNTFTGVTYLRPESEKTAVSVNNTVFQGVWYLPLDYMIVTNSRIISCHIFYSGALLAYIDDTVKITNSLLELGPNVDPNSLFVVKMPRLFPTLRIKKGNQLIQ